MGKRLILAVAGAGKTTYIKDRLDLDKRFLLVTYTLNNEQHLREIVINKFGYMPSNIKIMSHFSFVYNFCYKPYLKDIVNDKGIVFLSPPIYTRKSNIYHYVTPKGSLYSARLSLLCVENSQLIQKRLEKYYDCFYYDEAQDLASRDFELLLNITSSNMDTLFVGDFYQHTFDTSRDGNFLTSLHNNYANYVKECEKYGFEVDSTTLDKSHRCSKTVCDFVREKIGITIYSHNDTISEIQLVNEDCRIKELMADNSIIKLFYQNSSKYNCHSLNWGESKGLDDFDDICIILNATTLTKYNNDKLSELAPKTRNKFYVACTRARRNIYFIAENKLNSYLI